MIKSESYLELNAYSNFYSIRYKPNTPVTSMDIISIIPEFSYNYIWEEFLRFKIGVDLPLSDVTLFAQDEIIAYNQFRIGFKIGLSIVVD